MSSPSTLGSYRLIAELGQGGMSDVYLAASEGPAGSGFTKLTVVKKLRSHLADDPEFVAMLMDEARLTARLTHPNVVQLFEVGEVEGQYFLAMEYLEGQPMDRVERRIERQARRSGTPVDRDVYYAAVSDMLAGLHYAHELADYDGTPLEVVHRDVTPHNVFVTYAGAVKVVDFGIAKAVGRATETQHGVVKGKVRYMSPEQAACKRIDRRTDVFAAGAILWNLATGAKLWADRNDVEVVQALYAGDYPASPRAIHPEVPAAIDAICQKALARDREDRYATAAAMRADLEAFLGQRSAEARKKLASTMKALFESDRAKVRAVLDASGLTSGASMGELAATVGIYPRPRAAPAAPVAPVAPVARVSARSRSVEAALPKKIRAADPPKGRTSPRREYLVAIAITVVAAVAAVAVILARAGRAPTVAPASEAVRSVVDSERTSLSQGTRSKAPLLESVEPVVAEPSSRAARTAAPVSPVRAASRVATASSIPAAPAASPEVSLPVKQGAERPRQALDSADPWPQKK